MLGAAVETASSIASSLSVTNVALVCGVLLLYLVYNSTRRPAGMPPGPTPYPLIGSVLCNEDEVVLLVAVLPVLLIGVGLLLIVNLHCLMKSNEFGWKFAKLFRKKPAQEVFKDCSRKHGNLFSVKVGKWWIVVLNDIELVREAFAKKPIDFADRPKLYSMEIMTEGYKDILFSCYNDTWRLHRKLAHSVIRHFASSKQLEKVLEEVTDRMSERLDESEGHPINPHDVVCLGVYNILTTLAFGESYDFDHPTLKFFLSLQKELTDLIGQGFAADYFPIARYIPTKAKKRFLDLLEGYLEKMHEFFSKHRETYDPDNLRDFCDSLIHAQQEAIDEGSEHVNQLTDTHLVQTVSDLFGAGTDTTIATMTFTVALIAEHPDVQQKCADEVLKVIGQDRFPFLTDRGNLPYVEATQMEILRYTSIAPLAIPHTTHCDTTLRGYSIPKGTLVIPNLLAIHRDQQYWDEPDKFKPEHFLDESGTIRQHPDAFIPFGAGRRSCLGEALAKSEIFLLLCWMFQKYEFSKVPGMEEKSLIDLDPWEALVRLPKSYQVICKKRPAQRI